MADAIPLLPHGDQPTTPGDLACACGLAQISNASHKIVYPLSTCSRLIVVYLLATKRIKNF
jgi:hypothetical protein